MRSTKSSPRLTALVAALFSVACVTVAAPESGEPKAEETEKDEDSSGGRIFPPDGVTGTGENLDPETAEGVDGGGAKDSGIKDSGPKDSGTKDSGPKDAGSTSSCTAPSISCSGACISPTTVDHCGSCTPCLPAPENATRKCVTGSCAYYCKGGFHPDGFSCVPDAPPPPPPPPPPPACLKHGSDCSASAECCNHDCFYGICICLGLGNHCDDDTDCCPGYYCGVHSKTCRGTPID